MTIARRVLPYVLSALLLHLLLVQPNHPGAMTWTALTRFPLELPFILLGLLALGVGPVAGALRIVLVAALMLVAVLKAADLVMFTALGRGFNPVTDVVLAGALLNVVSGAIGSVAAVVALGAAICAIALVTWLAWWATGVWSRARPPLPTMVAAGLAAAALVVLVGKVGHEMRAWRLPVDVPGMAFTARVGVERVVMVRTTIAELAAFRALASEDTLADRTDLFGAIDRDVLVVFVESYGRASMDTPLYAETHVATLREGQETLSSLGLAMRSGYLASPTKGGQSWLAHATFANGLWITDQNRYAAALASGRRTLFTLARQSGFETAAVMPQITMDWPESATMGFDTILAAADLGYRGLPFNWVTMPDQYTLLAMERMLRERQDRDRRFIQVALSSSHAPWVPVPELVPWEEIGDGRIFNEMASAGDTPEVVWRDRDRIRDQYRMAIDYSLRTVIDYAARLAGDPPLMIVVGDHQAAGFVALDERPDVPIHVIGPEALVSRVEAWGFTSGLVPDGSSQVRNMSEMRDLLVTTFSASEAAR